MNPQNLNNIGNGILNAGANALAPVLRGGFGMANQFLGNMQHDFAPDQTRQLPSGVQSSIPTSLVLPHPAAGSLVEEGVNGLGGMLSKFFQANPHLNPQVLGTQTSQMPSQHPSQMPTQVPTQMPQATPTPTSMPNGHVYDIRWHPIQQATPTPTPMPQEGVRQVQQLPQQIPGVPQEISQRFVGALQQMLPITRQYGIPDALVAAQAAQESGYGTSQAAQQNNFFGLMHFDPQTSARSLHTFNNLQDAAHFYAQTVTQLVPGVKNMSPLQALQALQSGAHHYEGDNQNPNQYVTDVSSNPAWQAFGGGTPYQQSPKKK